MKTFGKIVLIVFAIIGFVHSANWAYNAFKRDGVKYIVISTHSYSTGTQGPLRIHRQPKGVVKGVVRWYDDREIVVAKPNNSNNESIKPITLDIPMSKGLYEGAIFTFRSSRIVVE